MKEENIFDIIIVGGSYSGLAQTPHSHNFLTQDGQTPKQIAELAKQQVQQYDTVTYFDGLATSGIKRKGEKTGVLGNGENGFELAQLISNWTNDLTLFTNGTSTLTAAQLNKLENNHIKIEEKEIDRLEHTNGQLHHVVFKDGSKSSIPAIYVRSLFEQHCKIPEAVGCELTDEGYIKTDAFQETTVSGVWACGDNSTRFRTVANAVAMGTAAGMTISKKTIQKNF